MTTVMWSLARAVRNISTMVEHKVPVPAFRGTGAPQRLSMTPQEFIYEPTPQSEALRMASRHLFGERVYRFRLSTALSMSSNGAGIVNAVINTASVGSLGDFTALSGIFNEFFVVRFDVKWEPASMYNGPVGYSPATTVSSLPLGCAQLQHAAATYSTLGAMTESYDFRYENTGRPFTYAWVNVEDINTKTVPETSGPSQSWAPVAYASTYNGSLQFLTAALPTLPVSANLGTFAVHYEVAFRLRD